MTSSSTLKRGLLWALGVFCVLVLAGCAGGSQNTNTSNTTRTKNDVEVPGVFPDRSAMKIIQDRGKLIVGVPMDRPPFVSRNVSTGSIEGFDVEIARLIAAGIFGAQLEGKIEFVEIDTRDRSLLLEQNRIDIAMGRFEITVPDKRFVDFAGPYFIAQQQLLVNNTRERGATRSAETATISAANQLSNRSVCVVRGSTKIDLVRNAIPGVDTSMIKDTVDECIAEVGSRAVPAVIADKTDLLPYTRRSSSSNLTNVALPNVPGAPYGIGVSKERVDLRTYINDRLELIKTDRRWQSAYEATIDGDDEAPAIERY